MKILVTGGGGYIGSVLVPLLLNEGHQVTIYDNFFFGTNPVFPLIKNKEFNIIKGDIRDENKIASEIKKNDLILHLAAIVGYPACRKDPIFAKSVNIDGTKIISKNLSKNQFILYGSTGSNYGEVTEICTEETQLKPLSLYGQTKTFAENHLLNHNTCIAYRFATAFGASPRLRLDLLVNDFTYKAVTQGYVVVYESHFMRTFIHVDDIANSWIFAINNIEKMKNDVFNVGSNELNFSKKEICEKINKKVKQAYFHYANVGEDKDKRNYKVSYDKIQQLGFKCSKKIEDGIDEIIKLSKIIDIKNNFFNA